MRHVIGAFLSVSFLVAAHVAGAWDRSQAATFAVLPPGSAHPEGITTGADGNFYVVTWDYDRASPFVSPATGFQAPIGPGTLGHLIVFSPDGKLVRRVEIANSSSLLGDVAFQPGTGNLLVVDFGGKRVLKVDPRTGASSVFVTVPGEKASPNGMTFDRKGNIYLTDSLQGTVWRAGPGGGQATPWVKTDLLVSHGYPSLGANGLAFDRAESALFVGNTGDDRIIRIPVVAGEAGTPEIWVNSVNGPDGMFFDEQDRLWVVANQADEVVVFDKAAKIVAKLGDFDGIDERGMVRGLLFPAEIHKHGDFVYVGNLSVDARHFKVGPPPGRSAPPTGIAAWADQVKAYTIVRMPARIPPMAR